MTSAALLAQYFRSTNLSNTELARSHVSAQAYLALPSKFDKAGPAAKVRLLASANPPADAMCRFLGTCTRRYIFRKGQDPLRSAAPGAR